MKKLFVICIAAVAAMCAASAQEDERMPGLYAVNGEESVRLTPVMSAQNNSSTGILGVEIGKTIYKYKGETSDTKATGTFVLVCDMKKKVIKQTLKDYDVFIKTMTPDNIIIIPLEVDKGRRIYDEGLLLDGIRTEVKGRAEFEWERISDNSFIIRTELAPGEYAIAFRPARLGSFEFTAVFDFTVE